MYHTGTDAVCFEKGRFFVSGGTFGECEFNDVMLDDNEYLVSSECIVI